MKNSPRKEKNAVCEPYFPLSERDNIGDGGEVIDGDEQ